VQKSKNKVVHVPEHHTMCTEGMKVELHHTLTSVLDVDEWSSSFSGYFRSGKRDPEVPIGLGGWVGFSLAGQNVEKKIPFSCQELNPDHPVHSISP